MAGLDFSDTDNITGQKLNAITSLTCTTGSKMADSHAETKSSCPSRIKYLRDKLIEASSQTSLEELFKKSYWMKRAMSSLEKDVTNLKDALQIFWPVFNEDSMVEYGKNITNEPLPHITEHNKEKLKQDIEKNIAFCEATEEKLRLMIDDLLNNDRTQPSERQSVSQVIKTTTKDYDEVSNLAQKMDSLSIHGNNEQLNQDNQYLKKGIGLCCDVIDIFMNEIKDLREESEISVFKSVSQIWDQETERHLNRHLMSPTSEDQDRVLKLKEKIERLSDCCAQLKKENQQMKKDIGVVCHEKAILKQKLIKEREDTEIKEKEHSTLLRDILQGQSERSTHEKQRHQLQTDFSESQRKCQELNQKLHENERKLYHSNQELQQKCQDLEKLREDIQEMKGYSDSLEKNIEKSQFRISELEQIGLHKQQLIQSLTAEKENALTRLSKMAGNKLSHNNAAIVDLSDPDRPTKLAEKFSEIYDNIWTDAFEDLNAVIGGEDINIISVLLKTLRYVYETAVVDVISYEKSIRRSPLFAPSLYSGMSEADSTAEQTVLEEFYKDLQHQKTVSEMMLSCSKLCSESFSKKMLVLCETQDTEATNAGLALQQSSSKFRIYIVECAKICWLMRLRRPPMHLTFESGEKFDGNIFKQYTKSGERIHYFVWPYLQLHENGPLLAKGVAQPY